MKTTIITTIALLVVFSMGLSISPHAIAGDKIYVMRGTIKAIDEQYNTVVIEVPLSGKTFTVGGPLSANAVLKKGGRSVGLADFKGGEKVEVRWRATASGHVIEKLESV